MKEILFVGDVELTEAFGAFGFRVRPAASADDFRSALAEAAASPELKIVFASSELEIPPQEAAALAPSADVFYLPAGFDRARLVGRFKALSEKASGVDLTGKLIET